MKCDMPKCDAPNCDTFSCPPPIPDTYKTPECPKYDHPQQRVYKDCCVVGTCDEKGEIPPVGTIFMDLPKCERKKYMWMVPKECRKDCCYDMEPDEYKEHVRRIKAEPEERRKKEEKERKKKDDDKDATIQQLVAHVAKLTEVVNKLSSGAITPR